MPRPKQPRKIRFNPQVDFFKPAGVPLRSLEIVALDTEEGEALRLKHIQNLNQTVSAKKMGVSQSTFQRILVSAYAKMSDAIINGKGIRITNEIK